jgi:hypothetical protein
MKRRWVWCKSGPLGLILLVFCLLVASRWLAWYEWIVGDTPQRSGMGGPHLPRDPIPVPQDPDSAVPQIEYRFGSWQGQDAIPIGMAIYLVLLPVSGVLCWATLAHALPSHITLELALLCCFVGAFVWLGVLPLLWFWILFRSGLFNPLIHSSEILIVQLDVTFVRLCLQGPLVLLAGVLLSIVAFVWERICPSRETSFTVTPAA